MKQLITVNLTAQDFLSIKISADFSFLVITPLYKYSFTIGLISLLVLIKENHSRSGLASRVYLTAIP